MEPTMPAIFELEAKEQEQLEKDYSDWCKKFDPNYIVERQVTKTNKTENQSN